MNCMKCGREIADNQAFCTACLKLMDQRPVPQDVVVQIPLRRDPALKKYTPRKKVRTTEEQLLRAKRKNRWLIAVICLLMLLSMALATMSFYLVHQLEVQKTLGQNYSTAEAAE